MDKARARIDGGAGASPRACALSIWVPNAEHGKTVQTHIKIAVKLIIYNPIYGLDMFGTHCNFELTEGQVAQIFHREIYRQVIATRAFQRLKKIHFLGSLDYVIDPEGPKPNKRHTRFQHSLGVARLALQFARDRRLEERDEILSVVAALLHDI